MSNLTRAVTKNDLDGYYIDVLGYSTQDVEAMTYREMLDQIFANRLGEDIVAWLS